MTELRDRYIRFDWAIKSLLRQKANFGVLEGFLTVFLNEPIKIVDILESEGNQQAAEDKFNRVDIKAKNSKGEIIIVDIHAFRILYYCESIYFKWNLSIFNHINLGNTYKEVKKYIPSAFCTLIWERDQTTSMWDRTTSWVCIPKTILLSAPRRKIR